MKRTTLFAGLLGAGIALGAFLPGTATAAGLGDENQTKPTPMAEAVRIPDTMEYFSARGVSMAVARDGGVFQDRKWTEQGTEDQSEKALNKPEQGTEDQSEKALNKPAQGTENQSAKALNKPEQGTEDQSAKALNKPEQGTEDQSAKALNKPAQGTEDQSMKALNKPEQVLNKRIERRTKRAQQAELVVRTTDSLLKVGRFLFVPTRVVTSLAGMPYATLNTYYEVAVTRDSLVCGLPYYGYVYNTVYDRDKSPFFFSSADFTYAQKGVPDGKQKGWVTIKAKEVGSNREFTLTFEVFANGSASLSIQGGGTQQLQFLGNVLPIPGLSGL